MFVKDLLVFIADLDDRFKTVSCKCWREDQKFFHPLLSTLLNHNIRKRLDPFFIKARLKTNGVFFFGDLNEDTVTNGSETVRFSDLIRDRSGYRLMEDLGTKPSVYYLPPVDRLFPFKNEDKPADHS